MMLIDGKEGDLISASDRGLLYGDGLFETIAVHNGTPQLWSLHMRRLHDGCRRLGIAIPDSDLLRQEAERVCTGARRAVLKVIITRGSGGRGYRIPQPSTPRRIVVSHPWPDYPQRYYREGIRARLCTTPLAVNPLLAGMKHLNRLEQVMARSEWDDPEIAEGIMLDTAGNLVEGTMSNLFLVRQGTLVTPPVEQCGVAGVMREHVLSLAEQMGIPSEIARLGIRDLEQADEVFFTNSIIGIWPLRQLRDIAWQCGPVTQHLMQVVNIREEVSDA